MAFLNMETSTEILLFSVDAIISIILLKSYNRVSRYIVCLQEVSAKEGRANDLDSTPSGESDYVMIKGPVKALGNSISSLYVPTTLGVVQKLSTRELVTKRDSSGFWWNETRPIHHSYNVVPFAILVKNCAVEVQDVLLGDGLSLETVFNKYDRTEHSLANNVWSYFSGVRQYGVQTMEEMLKEGTVVTGIGDLVVKPDGSHLLTPPTGSKPYYITTQPLSSLLQDLRDKKSLYGTFLVITGGLTIFFGGLLIRRVWISYKKRRDKLEMQRRLDESRRSRRQNVRDNDLPDNLRCVVCQDNPREVIMLPCGHLCVCEDCSEELGTSCPICRSHVVTKAAAFLS